MKHIHIITFITSLIIIMSCNKPHDYSYKTGKFNGEILFKEIILVDGVKTDELSYDETGSITMTNNDSLNFIFMNSLYSVDRTFFPSPSNTYQYTLASDKINDRFDVEDKGMVLKYYGTRELKFDGNDTVRFIEVSFSGNRE